MAYGFKKPVASLNGLPCSGHGLCLPPVQHSVQPCKSPPRPKSIRIKNFSCYWPPFPLIPQAAVDVRRATVLVNGIPIMLHGDKFTPHISPCTNIIVYMCPCGQSICPVPTPVNCSLLTTEDGMGKGHPRVVQATTAKVFALKRPVARALDPLGAGKPGKSYPCSSVVAYGSPNVLSS
jgi:uncharacterized Zn-binding protein involved in type VI secretion